MKRLCRSSFGVVLLFALSAASQGAGATVVTPELFGAKGDGRADDTTALQRAAEAIQKAGEGVLVLKFGAVYRVGRQTHTEGKTPYWKPEPVMRLSIRGTRTDIDNIGM
jgi:hypothetical protein